ncbi:unnamed protein product [Fusarium venenatum]|uniref:Uncharacterized protein n=2 Tax=Fusarium venenatum TaxID=56646 RepID=A0A2L2TAU0_9HYPO|nr:uncharacterized protein FVRRES_11323 [Fusarium venenatum]CEI38632.1 unnamed protein product [Fusarium venenatum]
MTACELESNMVVPQREVSNSGGSTITPNSAPVPPQTLGQTGYGRDTSIWAPGLDANQPNNNATTGSYFGHGVNSGGSNSVSGMGNFVLGQHVDHSSRRLAAAKRLQRTVKFTTEEVAQMSGETPKQTDVVGSNP